MSRKKPASSGSTGSGSSAFNKSGKITPYEFKHDIKHEIKNEFGRKKGSQIQNILDNGDLLDNRGMTANEMRDSIKRLRNNKSDNLSNRDIDKLTDILNSRF